MKLQQLLGRNKIFFGITLKSIADLPSPRLDHKQGFPVVKRLCQPWNVAVRAPGFRRRALRPLPAVPHPSASLASPWRRGDAGVHGRTGLGPPQPPPEGATPINSPRGSVLPSRILAPVRPAFNTTFAPAWPQVPWGCRIHWHLNLPLLPTSILFPGTHRPDIAP